jgi:hypothetical protein
LSQHQGFSDVLTALGSYHVFDFDLVYENARANARDRVVTFHARHP